MNTIRTQSFPTRLPLAAAGLALLILQSGCVGGAGHVTSLPPLPDSLRVPPGSMVIVAAPASRPTLSFAPSSGRIGDPALGAVASMRGVGRAGGGSGEAAIVALMLLPGAALVGAITESGRQATPAQVAQFNQDLDSRLRTAAGHGQLHGVFFDVARVRNDLEFTSVSGIGADAFEDAGRSRRDGAGVSFLELGVEELHLRRQGLGDGCALEISARVRFRRAGHAGPAYDQRVTFRSGVSDSICWSEDNARPLLRVADYGYRMIAEEISGQLFGGRK